MSKVSNCDICLKPYDGFVFLNSGSGYAHLTCLESLLVKYKALEKEIAEITADRDSWIQQTDDARDIALTIGLTKDALLAECAEALEKVRSISLKDSHLDFVIQTVRDVDAVLKKLKAGKEGV